MNISTIRAGALIGVWVAGFVMQGCNGMARSLGSIPVAMSQSQTLNDRERDSALSFVENGETRYLLEVFRVDADGNPTTRPTTDEGVYRIADVTELGNHFFLGREPGEEIELRQRRAVIAMKLMDIADTNGAEYWRRFAATIAYERSARAGAKVLAGAGIAATFISPVLGASLSGAGLAVDAAGEKLFAGFDLETYSAMREAVRAEVLKRKTAIREKLNTRNYLDYPAGAVVAEISNYANIYSIRGAMDALKAVARDAHERAREADSK